MLNLPGGLVDPLRIIRCDRNGDGWKPCVFVHGHIGEPTKFSDMLGQWQPKNKKVRNHLAHPINDVERQAAFADMLGRLVLRGGSDLWALDDEETQYIGFAHSRTECPGCFTKEEFCPTCAPHAFIHRTYAYLITLAVGGFGCVGVWKAKSAIHTPPSSQTPTIAPHPSDSKRSQHWRLAYLSQPIKIEAKGLWTRDHAIEDPVNIVEVDRDSGDVEIAMNIGDHICGHVMVPGIARHAVKNMLGCNKAGC